MDVVLPPKAHEIGARAFSDIDTLKSITFADDMRDRVGNRFYSIGDSYRDGDRDTIRYSSDWDMYSELIVYGYKGSFAEAFFKDHVGNSTEEPPHIIFRVIDGKGNVEEPDPEVEEINSDAVYVVGQKFDVTADGCLGQSYAKYMVAPSGAASVSKGVVTVKKAPADGKITVSGCVKNSKGKYVPEKAYIFTAQKPVFAKTLTLSRPYFADINPDDENASRDGNALVTGTDLRPDAWVSSKPGVAAVDPDMGLITAVGKGTAKITAVYGSADPADKNAAKYSFSVKVSIPVISKKEASLQSGATLALTLKGADKKICRYVESVKPGCCQYRNQRKSDGAEL